MARESEIDELFQLPLGEFTAARNALAKSAGKDGAAIRALTKPPLAAWAVNQLYWKDPDTYEALIAAANEMRQAHKAVIQGKAGDLRTAGREHDLAIDAALKSALAILEESGNPITDATRQGIVNTLRALPSDEPPGRLTRTLAPGGFEMLAGITPAAAPKRPPRPAVQESPAARGKKKDEDAAAREAARKREARAAAERAVRDADQKARHAEFEAARAARDASKAARRLDEARRAFEEARQELEEAEQQAERTEGVKAEADERSQQAQAALDQARKHLQQQTS
ncbi:MAG TPA: hypothetical protein VGD94_22770 [Vicinamibacterales bacterium]